MASFVPNESGRSAITLAAHTPPSRLRRRRRLVLRHLARSWRPIFAALVVSAVIVPDAGATTLEWTNPCSADLDPGVCERVGYLAQQLHDGTGSVGLSGNSYGALYFIAGAIIGTPLAVMFIRVLFGQANS